MTAGGQIVDAMNPSQWPRTVDATVTILLAKLSREHKAEIRGMKKEELIDGCHDPRIHIGSQFGMLQNKPLLENNGKRLDTNGTVVVIEAL
ncbi:MAG: hypothetical protein HZA88_06115 [Verrucomicrobia bacterium]|nr:hypothetical protein [Verrucomicrobiota bacterium]